jgi:hypothetical protein
MYQLLRFGWCKTATVPFAKQWKKRLSFTFFSYIGLVIFLFFLGKHQ